MIVTYVQMKVDTRQRNEERSNSDISMCEFAVLYEI